ncbi:hypothetical protein [Photorhabdus sp. SF281]|uniref:hypothetical protein n=1 Tax=Photorhabdus sp. SF281 TaxID=3459527 RepID=UPI004044DF1E
MTIAQKLEQKGYRKGFLEGYQKGLVEGCREATLKIAHSLLNSGIDRETVMKITGLNPCELEQMPGKLTVDTLSA